MPGADMTSDLERRGRIWGYSFDTGDVSELAWFAAALARAEAEAWADDAGPVATKAYADRRFFLADRVFPWLVPWFDVVGRCYRDVQATAHADRDWLLRLGERMRPAPSLAGPEGMSLPGFDGYGPLEMESLLDRVASLWGGVIVLQRTAESIAGRALGERGHAVEYVATVHSGELRHHYETAAARWRRLATDHPGLAGYFTDLATRAGHTAGLLGS